MIREDLQHLKTNVEGRTVFILGGGLSVTSAILTSLNKPKVKVLALNSGFKWVQNPTAVLWCDHSWAGNNFDVLSRMACPIFAARTNIGRDHLIEDTRTVANSTVLGISGKTGYDPNIDYVRGNNSGAYAINLLVNCKAKNIILVGFDMRSDRGKAHFHDDYTYCVRGTVYKDLFIPCIESMYKEMKEMNVKVNIYNANSDSELKCFPFINMDDFI